MLLRKYNLTDGRIGDFLSKIDLGALLTCFDLGTLHLLLASVHIHELDTCTEVLLHLAQRGERSLKTTAQENTGRMSVGRQKVFGTKLESSWVILFHKCKQKCFLVPQNPFSCSVFSV